MTTVRTEVLGVPVDAVTMRSAIDAVRGMLADSATNLIFAVNPEKVIAAQRDPDLCQILENASMVIPDGIGVVVAARLLGKGRMERVPGSDLMPEICQLAGSQGSGIFLYGAKPSIAAEAASIMQRRYPDLIVAGTQHGYVSDAEMDGVLEKINTSGAEILFVGLGSPRQEQWLSRYQERLNVKVCQGVGGTFDAICGNPKRAPVLCQKLHMEWLYRLATQPHRAIRQSALPRFALQVLRQALRGRK